MRKGLFIILMLLLTVSGAALAQDTHPVFCGDLSEADCAIVEQSQTAMQGLTAASADFSVDVQIEAEGQTIPISLTGSTTFSGFDRMDHELDLSNMTEMPDITPMLDALRGFNAELIITFTLPEPMAQEMHAPESLGLELRLVDGVGYINFDALQGVIRDMELSGWGGLDIAGMIGALAAEITPEMLSQFGDMAAMSGADPAMMARFSNMEFVMQYVSVTRTDDGSGATATFETTVDLAGMMQDPAMQDMIREQMAAQAEAQGTEMSDSEMQVAMGMVGMMFEESNIVVTEEIDTATGLIASANFSMNMDLSNMAEMSNDNTGSVVIAVNASVTYGYDDIPTVAAPEDANVFPYERLIGMLMGMNMQQS